MTHRQAVRTRRQGQRCYYLLLLTLYIPSRRCYCYRFLPPPLAAKALLTDLNEGEAPTDQEVTDVIASVKDEAGEDGAIDPKHLKKVSWQQGFAS